MLPVWNIEAVSASRLVKSPDSHASDPCSRLGGSSWLCYRIYFISEFNEMPEIFWRHLAWKAESSLSEDELSHKVLGPAVYTKIYCRVQWNWVLFIPVQWENRVTLTMKRIEAAQQFPMIKQLPWQLAINLGGCRRIPYIGSERKNSVRKTGERYKHREEKSGSVALRPVEIPPLYRIWRTSPAYSCSSTSSWPLSRLYPVLCLDAISQLGKWAPGGIITFFFIFTRLKLHRWVNQRFFFDFGRWLSWMAKNRWLAN